LVASSDSVDTLELLEEVSRFEVDSDVDLVPQHNIDLFGIVLVMSVNLSSLGSWVQTSQGTCPNSRCLRWVHYLLSERKYRIFFLFFNFFSLVYSMMFSR
jgi:hypothetical protein